MAKRLVCSYLLVCSAVVIVFTMHIGWLWLLFFRFRTWTWKSSHFASIFFCTRVCCYQRWPIPMLRLCIDACPYANLNRIKRPREWEIFVRLLFISRLHVPAICKSPPLFPALRSLSFSYLCALCLSVCLAIARKSIVSAFSALFI